MGRRTGAAGPGTEPCSWRGWVGRDRRLGGEGEDEAAAGPGRAVGPDPAPMGLDQRLADRQPEPAAAAGPAPGRIQPGEASKDPGKVLAGDPGADAGPRQPGPAVGAPDPDLDPAVGAGVLDGVVDQVGDHLGEASLVGQHRWHMGGPDGEVDAALV